MEVDPLDTEVQVKIEEEEFNPWAVTDASEFLKYHCPECPFQDAELDAFSCHALANHERSKVLFQRHKGAKFDAQVAENLKQDTKDDIIEEVDEEDMLDDDVNVPEADLNLVEDEDEDYENEICQELKCNECNKFYASKAKLHKHWYSCHKPKVTIPVTLIILIKCDMCEETFDDEKLAKVHCKKEHKGESKMKFQCDRCDSLLSTRTNLEGHIQAHLKQKSDVVQRHSHNKIEDKSAMCDLCGAKFNTRRGLQRHMLRIHIEGPLQICSTCGYSTTSIPKFQHHEKTAHKKRKYDCEFCDKAFMDRQHYEIHLDRMHPDSAPTNFKCDFCDKAFIYERSLKNHKFHCSKQDYIKQQREKARDPNATKRKYDFHREVEKKNKVENTPMEPIKCDYCDHVFTERTNIKIHYIKNHNGQPMILEGLEKFKCNMCDSVQFTEGRLKLHFEMKHKVQQ